MDQNVTSPSPLERLATPGNVLAKEPPDAKEFDGLVRSGLARLKDAERESNLDSRFDLAYSAAHALCLAALRHHGFRPSKRYIVFQVLPDSLSLGPEVWRVLSKCHDMRNRAQFRLESFRVTNRPNSGLPSAPIGDAKGARSWSPTRSGEPVMPKRSVSSAHSGRVAGSASRTRRKIDFSDIP